MIESRQALVTRLDNAKYAGRERPESDITEIVMHCTAGDSAMSSIEYLNRDNSDHKASYHYLIDRDGQIFRMTPPTRVAYHAGDSAWPNPVFYPPGNEGRSVNAKTIGIAWANRNDGEELTHEQLLSALWLCRFFMDRLGIPPSRVYGHSECSPGRKTDPKPAVRMSDWRRALAAGDLTPIEP